MGPKSLAGIMFQALMDMDKSIPSFTRAPRLQWMLGISFRMIDSIVDHCRQADHNLHTSWNLINAVKISLTVDTRHRAESVAEEIGACLETP